MSRRLDVINPGAMDRPAPAMPTACSSHGCGGPEPDLPPPPSFGELRVNGVEIPPEAIAREIQHHPAPDAETAWIEAARALAVRELLLQEARRRGLEAVPERDAAGRDEEEGEALIRALLEVAVNPASPGEEECRRYYDANQDRFQTPDLFEAAHILIEPASDDEQGWSSAEQRARSLALAVGDDARAFAAAARSHSACASAQQDGSLGQIRRGELVRPIQDRLETLGDGETAAEPVRSRFGWHVLRLGRKIPGQAIPYEHVRGKIADMLEARSWSLEAARYIAVLAGTGKVDGVAIDGSRG